MNCAVGDLTYKNLVRRYRRRHTIREGNFKPFVVPQLEEGTTLAKAAALRKTAKTATPTFFVLLAHIAGEREKIVLYAYNFI